MGSSLLPLTVPQDSEVRPDFFLFFPPLFKYINLPELITVPDKVAMESTQSKRQISDWLSAIPCLQLPGRKRLEVLPADSKSLG